MNDKLFPYWFYPAMVVAIVCCLVICFGWLYLFWELFKIGFGWLVGR